MFWVEFFLMCVLIAFPLLMYLEINQNHKFVQLSKIKTCGLRNF